MIVQTDTIKIYNHHTISYLLISAPLFENNFLISIPIFLIEILFLFPEYSQTAGIYNQSLCCLDAYNKHLDANICLVQRTCNFCQKQHNQPAIVSWLQVVSSDKA